MSVKLAMPESTQKYLDPGPSDNRPIRPRLVGMMARIEGAMNTPMANIVKAFTVELDWSVAQPTQGGPLNLGKIATWNTYAENNNMYFRVRIFAGDDAPNWAKTLAGFSPMQWYSADGPGGTVGPFWRDDYIQAYFDFTEAFAARASEFPRMSEVTDSCMTTIYAEPYLRGWSAKDNLGGATGYEWRQDVINAGYNYQDDERGILTSMQHEYDTWSAVGVSVVHAINPYLRLNAPANTTKMQHASVTMPNLTKFQNMGKFAQPFNTSVGSPSCVRGANYTDLWNHMNDAYPTGIQTMTLAKMKTGTYAGPTPTPPGCIGDPKNSPYNTVAMCAQLGFINVELPNGTQDDADPLYRIDPSEAVVLNNMLAANNVPV